MATPISAQKNTSLGMIIDSSRCIDCKACLVSCKVANNVPANQWRNWIKKSSAQMDALSNDNSNIKVSYQPGGCMQCANAPCLEACPTGATYRNEADGVVMVDKGLCIGCGNCIPACPYGARFRHAVDNVVDKCDFCADRRAQGLQPACVDTCITKARAFGPIEATIEQTQQRFANEGAAPISRLVYVEPKETQTKPSLQYVNETAPQDWPVEPEIPLSMRLMAGLPGKGLYTVAALSLLGALGMCLTQFRESRMAKKQAAKQTNTSNKKDHKATEKQTEGSNE